MKLSVNIDHIATLRNIRGGNEPDPITVAHIAELAGAEGIVCHLREDRRHINEEDVKLLRKTIKTKLDLEMSTNDEIVKIAKTIIPDLVTIVPEKREELTTEGGLDIKKNKRKIQNVISQFHDLGINVSLFIEPNKNDIEIAKSIFADEVELHTGNYANVKKESKQIMELQKIQVAASYAKSLDLKVNAGHGLNYINIFPILEIKEIKEMSIGHSIISRAQFVGIFEAVKEMVNIFRKT